MNGLLAFSRAARTFEIDEASAPAPALKSVLEELAPQIAKLDVVVEVEELPDAQIRCSPGLLHIVLANLCGNAVKYLEGRSERRIRIAGRIDGATYQIVVEDTGPGIPKDALQKFSSRSSESRAFESPVAASDWPRFGASWMPAAAASRSNRKWVAVRSSESGCPS